MYIHVQRQFSTKRKGREFCFALNTFTYVSSTKRDSVVGVRERSGWRVRWAAGKPAEAPGRWGAGWGRPPSRRPPAPGSQGLHRLHVPQDGLWFAPDLAGCVWSHSVRCWKGYIHPLFAGACGSLTCCAVRRLPEDISAPAASPVVQFP